VTSVGAVSSADLGGSSDYSSERLEGLSGEGFRVQVILPRLSRRLKTQEKPLVGKFQSAYKVQGLCVYLGECLTAKGVAIPLPQ